MFPILKNLIGVATLAASCCAFAPATLHAQNLITPRYAQDQTAQVEAVSGRITSVQGNTFTLETQGSHKSPTQTSQDAQKVMTFTVDQNTTVEGKIQVDAAADVTYRVQSGNNIAVSVRVAPPQS